MPLAPIGWECFFAFGNRFEIVVGSFGDGFGIVLASHWDRLGIVSVSSWARFGTYRFGIVLVSFWDRFGIGLVPFWCHFGIVLGLPQSLTTWACPSEALPRSSLRGLLRGRVAELSFKGEIGSSIGEFRGSAPYCRPHV